MQSCYIARFTVFRPVVGDLDRLEVGVAWAVLHTDEQILDAVHTVGGGTTAAEEGALKIGLLSARRDLRVWNPMQHLLVKGESAVGFAIEFGEVIAVNTVP